MEWVILTVGLVAVVAAWDAWCRTLSNRLACRQFDESAMARLKLCESRLADLDAEARKAKAFMESQKAVGAGTAGTRLRIGGR